MAKAVGFTLTEIREFVDLCIIRRLQKKAQIGVLDRRLLQIDEKLLELEGMKKQINLCKSNIKKSER